MKPWIYIIGIGEDGLPGLGEAVKNHIQSADVLIGGVRHLKKVPEKFTEKLATRIVWGKFIHDTLLSIKKFNGQKVVVLASGDPMFFGVGKALLKYFGKSEVIIYPHPGAFSLAVSRMGWPLADVATLTVHGRVLECVNRYVYPDARLLILSRDGDTPAELARLLTDTGYGDSQITVLEHLGGDLENRIEAQAKDGALSKTADLNTIAVTCVAGSDAKPMSLVSGLDDDHFIHDGQITKRETRAVTMAQLAPKPHEILWDIGSGSGSVAIEWLRAHPSLKAYAVERQKNRVENINTNAARFGVPELTVIGASAPDCFKDISEAPHAIFIGGGLTVDGLMDQAWHCLRPGGRLVANAVTLQGEARLLACAEKTNARFNRLSIARSAAVGGFQAMTPMRAVLQMIAEKPLNGG